MKLGTADELLHASDTAFLYCKILAYNLVIIIVIFVATVHATLCQRISSAAVHLSVRSRTGACREVARKNSGGLDLMCSVELGHISRHLRLL